MSCREAAVRISQYHAGNDPEMQGDAMRPLTQIEIREVDQIANEQFGIPGVVLMENAGRGCSHLAMSHWRMGRVVICCGRGNNGGDGFVMARYLENAGWSVQIRLAFPPSAVRGDAAVFLESVQKSGLDVRTIAASGDGGFTDPTVVSWIEFQSELRSADLVVDALLGTGLTGEVRSPCREIIELRYYGELSYQEISVELELNEKTVSSRLSKCLDRLESIARRIFSGKKTDPFPV